MNEEKGMNNITPNLKFLTNRPEIIAEQTRLNTRDLLSESIHSIHEYHDGCPDGAHIVTKLDDTDKETLLVGRNVETVYRWIRPRSPYYDARTATLTSDALHGHCRLSKASI
jgi:hypothetical protein